MYFLLWFRRFFLSPVHFISFTPLVSIVSLILAVSCLVLGMSVYSGYETTVNKAIKDMTGDLVLSRSQPVSEFQLMGRIQKEIKQARVHSGFLHLKSLLAYEGRLSGVLLEGVDLQTVFSVLPLKRRLVEGTFDLNPKGAAVIGKSLAKKFHLKTGDKFHIIVPQNLSARSSTLHSRHKELFVVGILDFGFYEFNARQVLVSLKTARGLTSVGQALSGLRLLMPPQFAPQDVQKWSMRVKKKLGVSYRISPWGHIVGSISDSYMQTVKREKFIIFFILMILVLAGCFNVASHLSISVLNQMREISVLRAMGARSFFIVRLFLIQGLIVGLVGSVLGVAAGLMLSRGLVWLQNFWNIVPQEIYHVGTIVTDVRSTDLLLVLACSQVVCFLACVGPALKVFKMPLTDGLQSS